MILARFSLALAEQDVLSTKSDRLPMHRPQTRSTTERQPMKLIEYFESAKGTGVLATSNASGEVDAALYARPHVID